MFRTTFPDIVCPAEQMISESDCVLIRWTARGSNTGPLMMLHQTGKSIDLQGMAVSRS